MKYSRNYYDFDEGSMSFVSPGQVIAVDDDDSRDNAGWSLMIHLSGFTARRFARQSTET